MTRARSRLRGLEARFWTGSQPCAVWEGLSGGTGAIPPATARPFSKSSSLRAAIAADAAHRSQSTHAGFVPKMAPMPHPPAGKLAVNQK